MTILMWAAMVMILLKQVLTMIWCMDQVMMLSIVDLGMILLVFKLFQSWILQIYQIVRT